MASFTAKDVQLLRKKTGVGIMDCRDALAQAEGDMEKAIDVLREKGIATASKKADRVAAEGVVYAKVKGDLGVLVEVNSETDFVARNEKFGQFVCKIAETILENSPKDLEELKKCNVSGENSSVDEALRNEIFVLGENIQIRRFDLMNGTLATYVHGGGKIGVMVKFKTDLAQKPEFLEFGKNVAMHIAAACPQYLDSNGVSAEVLEKEKHILKQQMADSKKPENIIQKIVDGKIHKFYEEVCLLNQKYVKDSELTILDYVKKVEKDLGGSIGIVDFCRMERGEGVEK